MKLLLRHARTGFYFAGPSEWVTEPVLAFDFRAVKPALDFVVRHNPAGTESTLVESAIPHLAAAAANLTAEERK